MSFPLYNQDESLGRIVGRAALSLANRLNRLFSEAGHDVTVEQWVLLMELWHRDGQFQQQIADATFKNKTNVTRLINGLEKRNLVVRVPDPVDRRHKRIYLTRKAKALQKELKLLARENIDFAITDIDPGELAVCRKVLRKIMSNIQTNNG